MTKRKIVLPLFCLILIAGFSLLSGTKAKAMYMDMISMSKSNEYLVFETDCKDFDIRDKNGNLLLEVIKDKISFQLVGCSCKPLPAKTKKYSQLTKKIILDYRDFSPDYDSSVLEVNCYNTDYHFYFMDSNTFEYGSYYSEPAKFIYHFNISYGLDAIFEKKLDIEERNHYPADLNWEDVEEAEQYTVYKKTSFGDLEEIAITSQSQISLLLPGVDTKIVVKAQKREEEKWKTLGTFTFSVKACTHISKFPGLKSYSREVINQKIPLRTYIEFDILRRYGDICKI